MKEFITSLLNYLGFGVNGIVPDNETMFIGRISTYVPNMSFTRMNCSDKGFTIAVKGINTDSMFYVDYKYADGSRRIESIEVREK